MKPNNLTFIEALEAAVHTQIANNKNLELALDNLGHMGEAEKEYGLKLITKLKQDVDYALHLTNQITEHHQINDKT